jgi:hypothetical protein
MNNSLHNKRLPGEEAGSPDANGNESRLHRGHPWTRVSSLETAEIHHDRCLSPKGGYNAGEEIRNLYNLNGMMCTPQGRIPE